jgi:hypothetical protein
MILNTGLHVINKHAFWTIGSNSFIFIKSVNSTDVHYYYPEEIGGHLRRRYIGDFKFIEIVPATSLLLELL